MRPAGSRSPSRVLECRAYAVVPIPQGELLPDTHDQAEPAGDAPDARELHRARPARLRVAVLPALVDLLPSRRSLCGSVDDGADRMDLAHHAASQFTCSKSSVPARSTSSNL